MNIKNIIDKLYENNNANREELVYLLDNLTEKDKEYLIEKAHEINRQKGDYDVRHHCNDGFALADMGRVLEHQFFFHNVPSFLASSICFFAFIRVAATSILEGQT